jgi:hypothetical protein
MEYAVSDSDLRVSALTVSLLLSSGLNAIHVFSEGGHAGQSATGRLYRFLTAIRQGKPLERHAAVTFALYKYQCEEAPSCMETHNVRVGANGSYHVQLFHKSEILPLEQTSTPSNYSVHVKQADIERM